MYIYLKFHPFDYLCIIITYSYILLYFDRLTSNSYVNFCMFLIGVYLLQISITDIHKF